MGEPQDDLVEPGLDAEQEAFLRTLGISIEEARARYQAAQSKLEAFTANKERMDLARSALPKTAEKAEKDAARDRFNTAKAAEREAMLEARRALSEYDDAVLQLELMRDPLPDFSAMSPDEACAALRQSFGGAAFEPSPQPGLVRLNGTVDFDAAAFRKIPPSSREALIKAAKPADERTEEDQAVIDNLSKSGELRLRLPENAEEGRTFFKDLGLPDEERSRVLALYGPDEAPVALSEQYRAYDIANSKQGLSRESKKQKVRDTVATALSMNPTSLAEFTDMFNFAEAYANRGFDATATRGGAAAAAADPKAEDQGCKAIYDEYVAAVGSTGQRPGTLPACKQDALDFAQNRDEIQKAAAQLNFGAVSTAAYHTMKHYEELHDSEKKTASGRTTVENEVLSYHDGARGAVAAPGKWRAAPRQSGGETHYFDGPKVTAYVLHQNGAALLLTYF